MLDDFRRLMNAPAHEVETWFISWAATIFVPALLITTMSFGIPVIYNYWAGASGFIGYVIAFWATTFLILIIGIPPLFLLAFFHMYLPHGFDLSYPASARKPGR